MGNPKTIKLDGDTYVKQSEIQQPAEKVDGMEYVIIRCINAGVHAGYLKSRNGKEVVLLNSRRIWFWKGAASLSELAMSGPAQPKECKFTVPVNEITLTEAIEIIPCSQKGKESIEGVWLWKKN
jgi:hypothetical protein